MNFREYFAIRGKEIDSCDGWESFHSTVEIPKTFLDTYDFFMKEVLQGDLVIERGGSADRPDNGFYLENFTRTKGFRIAAMPKVHNLFLED